MKTIFLNLLLVLTLMLTSCGRKAGDETAKSLKEVYKYEKKESSKSYKDCKPMAENCSYIRLKYVDFTSGKNKEKLNAYINQELTKVYEMSEKKYSDVTQMQDAFIKDFGDFMKEYPEAPQVWTLDYELSVYSNTANFISIKEENDSYMGGAHPNYFVTFTNFYAESGEMMKLSDLMVTGFEVKLNKLIDRKKPE